MTEWVLAAALAGGACWVTWVAWKLQRQDASIARLRKSEHKQSNILHVLVNLNEMIARRVGVDTHAVEMALHDSGENL